MNVPPQSIRLSTSFALLLLPYKSICKEVECLVKLKTAINVRESHN